MRFPRSYRLSHLRAPAVLAAGVLLFSGCVAAGALEEPSFRSRSSFQVEPTSIIHLRDGSVIVARKEARMRTEGKVLLCYGVRHPFLRDTSFEGTWRIPIDSIAGFSSVKIAEDRRQLGSMLLIATWMFLFGATMAVAAAL